MEIVSLPTNFVLTDPYSKATIKTLARLVKFFNTRLEVDFSELKQVEKGAIIVLAAQMEKSILSNRNTIFRRGSLPKPKKTKSYFTKPIDAILHINKAITVPEITDSEKDKLLIPKLIDSIVKDLKKVGIKEYFDPFNVFLTELVGNAVEHGIENKKINWWLTHEIDKKRRVVKYTFVDMGLGIIKSHKKAGLPFKYFFKKDGKVLLDSLFGKLGSSTKQANRGRGLPQLREMIENQFVDNLTLITNTTCLKFMDGSFVTFKNPNFEGTYYSWTISKDNFIKWNDIKSK